MFNGPLASLSPVPYEFYRYAIFPMKLVVCEPENIPPWIFPDAMSEYPNAGSAIDIPELIDSDIAALASACELSINDPVRWENSGCSVGFPHDAPDFVPCIAPTLLETLANIPTHERWRTAERWATNRLGKRPSKEHLDFHKKLLNTLCTYAAIAVESDQIAVLIEPYA